MADLLVVTGPPGSGKSTVAPLVSEVIPAALVPGDEFFAFWTRGFVDPWLPAAHAQNEVVVRAAASAAGTFVAGGCTVVYEGVVGPWFLPAFTAATGLSQLHYAVLLPSLDRCLGRVAVRTGHGFTDPAATAHMHSDFAAAAPDTRHVLPVDGEEPLEVARSILSRYRDGSLRWPG